MIIFYFKGISIKLIILWIHTEYCKMIFLSSFKLPFTRALSVRYCLSLFLLSCWSVLAKSFLLHFWAIGGSCGFMRVVSVHGKFTGKLIVVRPESKILGHIHSLVVVVHCCSHVPVVYFSFLKCSFYCLDLEASQSPHLSVWFNYWASTYCTKS